MDKQQLKEEILEDLLSGNHSIQQHLDNLHDIMHDWLTYENLIRDDSVVFSVNHTYMTLRMMLMKLKSLEKTYNDDKVIND